MFHKNAYFLHIFPVSSQHQFILKTVQNNTEQHMVSPVDVMVIELKSCATHFLAQGLSGVDGNRPVLSQSHWSLGSQSMIHEIHLPRTYSSFFTEYHICTL